MAEVRLILASQSPRRAELLRSAGFRFHILSNPVDENENVPEEPAGHVRNLSLRKAEAVIHDVKSGVIIGADTIVYHQGRILGKPADASEAYSMLASLSGQTHRVYTGISLVEAAGRRISDVAVTDVTFRNLAEWEIMDYIASDEPFDKAGAYGIQGRAGLFVSQIRGCYFNVVGFPLARFFGMLGSIWNENQIQSVRVTG
ncbi:septum formation protein Maf [bacterium]|nr:septum formation protein Maf [bacterium]